MYRGLNRKLPLVLIDADGVLKLGYERIKAGTYAISTLRKYAIPFQIVTNDGGGTEESKAHHLSQILQLQRNQYITKKEMLLCHTPMQKALKHFSLKDKHKLPLVIGNNNTHTILKNYGITNYITEIEYALIFKHICPMNSIKAIKQPHTSIINEAQRRLRRRFNPYKPVAINSIFQLTECTNWEVPMQICSDLLVSKDGVPGTMRDNIHQQELSIHLGNPDVVYMDTFALPRFCGGTFMYSLMCLVEKTYGIKVNYTAYGKPFRHIYNYAIENAKKVYKGISIGNVYMIGDNPAVDIKGANDNGIYSMLVRTGIFKGKVNDEKYPAKKVVEDVNEAIEFILLKEKVVKV